MSSSFKALGELSRLPLATEDDRSLLSLRSGTHVDNPVHCYAPNCEFLSRVGVEVKVRWVRQGMLTMCGVKRPHLRRLVPRGYRPHRSGDSLSDTVQSIPMFLK